MKRWIKIAVTLLVVQLITYFTIADRQLKGKLLDDDWLSSIRYSTDSILVRDFYVTDCGVRGRSTYTSEDLSSDESLIKSKFRAGFVKFQKAGDIDALINEEDHYRLVYVTWTEHLPALSCGPF
ncbi:MAG: hypothetical protein QM762_03065 [Chryseolinea sp.]